MNAESHLDELVQLRDSVGTIFYAAPEVNFTIIIIIIINYYYY